MGNPWKMTRSDLELFAGNYVDQLDAHVLSGLTNAQQDALSLLMAGPSADLAAANVALQLAEAAYHAAVSVAEAAAVTVQGVAQAGKFSLKGASCPGADFALLGFDIPVTDPSTYVPNDPDELSAFGFSNGVNELRWVGNNLGGAVTYIIEAQIDGSPDWVTVGTTKKQRFYHNGVTPGVQYIYRVIARASVGDSMPSSLAIVY